MLDPVLLRKDIDFVIAQLARSGIKNARTRPIQTI